MRNKVIDFSSSNIDQAFNLIGKSDPKLMKDLGELHNLEEPWNSDLLTELIIRVAGGLQRLGQVDGYPENKTEASRQLARHIASRLWIDRQKDNHQNRK